MYWKRFTVAILSVAILGGCSSEDEKIIKKEEAKVVKTLNLKDGAKIEQIFEYPAHVEAFQDVTMAFEVSGKIVEFYFKEGQKITKDSIIAKLDDTIYKANYHSAKANYEQAQNDFTRYKKLLETRSVSQMSFEKYKQNLQVTKAALEVAKKNFEETNLKAEFDGIVAKKLVDDFARVTAKQPIVRLQDNSSYKIKFFVPETDMVKTKGNLTLDDISKLVEIYVTLGDSNKRYQAELIDISTTADKVTRTFEATLQIKKQNNTTILPGMTAQVHVLQKVKQQQKIYIPFKAVFTDASNKSFVWIVTKDERVRKNEIKIAQLSGAYVEVFSGLTTDSEIVTSGIRFLKENDLVKRYKKLGE